MDDLELTGHVITSVFGIRADTAIVFFEVAMPLQVKQRDGSSPLDKWLPCRLYVEDDTSGRELVRIVARWLGVAVPKRRGIEVTLTYNWFIQKLALNGSDGSHAEVYLNLLGSEGSTLELFGNLFYPRTLTLTEKDESYRKDIVRLLAETLGR